GWSCGGAPSSGTAPAPASSRSAKRCPATSAGAPATRASSTASCWPPSAVLAPTPPPRPTVGAERGSNHGGNGGGAVHRRQHQPFGGPTHPHLRGPVPRLQ